MELLNPRHNLLLMFRFPIYLLLLKLVFVSYHMLKFAKKKNEEILTYFTLIITPPRLAPSLTFPCYPVTSLWISTVDTTSVLTV